MCSDLNEFGCGCGRHDSKSGIRNPLMWIQDETNGHSTLGGGGDAGYMRRGRAGEFLHRIAH